MQDLFNHLRLPELALAQSCQVMLRSRSKTLVARKHHISPAGRSTVLVFRAQAGEVSFVVHGFITASLEIEGEHRMLDPKSLNFQGAVKIEPPKPEVQEDVSL